MQTTAPTARSGSVYRACRAVAVLSAVSLVAACGTSTTATNGTAASGEGSAKGPVGYSAPFLTDPFQVVEQQLTSAALKASGTKILAATNANGDSSKQFTDIQNLITAGAKGLVVGPFDSDAIIPALQFAATKKVPVVTLDIGPNGGKVAMIVRSNNVLMGQSACEQMGALVKGKGSVLELQGELAGINAQDRTSGFEACMKQKFPDVKVIAKPTKWQANVAADATQSVLGSTPDLAGIYLQSDGVMLTAVSAILKQKGRLAPAGDSEHIALVSIDGTGPALDAVRAKTLDAVVSQPADLYAKYANQYLLEALAGKTFKVGPTDHNSEVVQYKGNLMDLLPAPVVTTQNVEDKALWGNSAALGSAK